MTTLVVPDCSLTMAWCFEDEATIETEAILDSLSHGVEACVPSHWSLEIANVLLFAERKKRLSRDKASQFLTLLEMLPVHVDADTASRGLASTLNLARETGLTSYDAAYLELAIRRGASLASLDDALYNAAAARGITVLGR